MDISGDCRLSPWHADRILCGWVGVTSGAMAGEANNVHAFASPLPLSPPASGASFRFDARPGDFDIRPGSDDKRVPGRAVCGHGCACALAVAETVVRRRDPLARLRRPAGPATVPAPVTVTPAPAATAEPTTHDGHRRLATDIADALAGGDERALGAVGDDGMLYPCRRFAEAGAWPVGSVSESVDEAWRDAFLSAGNVDDRTPDASDCELVRGVAELGKWLLTEVWLRLSWGADEGGNP